MNLSNDLQGTLTKEPKEELHALIEVHLNGTITFEKLLSVLHNEYRIPHKLVKVHIEYSGQLSFGKLLLYLKGIAEENSKIIHYFNRHNIQYMIKGYGYGYAIK